jgi:hypothetical protein
MHAIEKLVHRCQDFVDAALLNQFGRHLVVQETPAGKEPQPRVVRLVDVGELVDDELQFEELLLGAGVGQRRALIPSGNGLGSYVQDVRHIGRPHGSLGLDSFQAACDRIAHGMPLLDWQGTSGCRMSDVLRGLAGASARVRRASISGMR